MLSDKPASGMAAQQALAKKLALERGEPVFEKPADIVETDTDKK